MGATRTIAEFAANPRPHLFTERAMHVASSCVRDAIGVGIHAAGTEIGPRLAAAFRGDVGHYAVLGSPWTVGAHTSVLVNGTLVHAEDWDDMGGCGGHDAAALVPGLLAIAHDRSLDGEAILRAYIVGYQVGTALNRSLEQGYEGFDRPWHPSGVIGPIAAACACGAALGLDADEMAAAIAVAAGFAGGLRGNFGSDAKPLQLGHAAATGYLAATLARAGITGDAEILERKNGYIACFAPIANVRHLRSDLVGRNFIESDDGEFLTGAGPAIKPWPVCGGNNLSLTLVDRLLRDASRRREDVAEIRIIENVPRRAVSLFRDVVERPSDGKFSIPFCIASRLWFGEVTPDVFRTEAFEQLQANGVLERVRWQHQPDSSLRPEVARCTATVVFTDGTSVSGEGWGRGRVLDDTEARAKFLGCVVPRLGQVAATKLTELLDGFQALDDLSEVLALLGGDHTVRPD